MVWRIATHLGVEIGLMAAVDLDVPVLRDDRVDGPDHLAGIQLPGRAKLSAVVGRIIDRSARPGR
jgi:hypothetical protein